MKLINTQTSYGMISILLHWSMAVLLIGMYVVGDYMVGLDYYDPWYHKLPTWHKALGVLLFALLIMRFIWNVSQPKPIAAQEVAKGQQFLATLVHRLLYLFVVVLAVSGYLISTAKGQGVDVFEWFEVPALFSDNAERGEIAGQVHALVATGFIVIVALHAMAALVHHFVFKDQTLQRMLGRSNQSEKGEK